MFSKVSDNHDGSALLEMAIVLPILFALSFGIVEMFFVYRAAFDLDTLVKIGTTAAQYGPSFNPGQKTMTSSELNVFSPQKLDLYEECLKDTWLTHPYNCGHTVVHIKMHRAFLQLHNNSLIEPVYTTTRDNNGIVSISLTARYNPTLFPKGLVEFAIMGFPNLAFRREAIVQNFDDV